MKLIYLKLVYAGVKYMMKQIIIVLGLCMMQSVFSAARYELFVPGTVFDASFKEGDPVSWWKEFANEIKSYIKDQGGISSDEQCESVKNQVNSKLESYFTRKINEMNLRSFNKIMLELLGVDTESTKTALSATDFSIPGSKTCYNQILDSYLDERTIGFRRYADIIKQKIQEETEKTAKELYVYFHPRISQRRMDEALELQSKKTGDIYHNFPLSMYSFILDNGKRVWKASPVKWKPVALKKIHSSYVEPIITNWAQIVSGQDLNSIQALKDVPKQMLVTKDIYDKPFKPSAYYSKSRSDRAKKPLVRVGEEDPIDKDLGDDIYYFLNTGNKYFISNRVFEMNGYVLDGITHTVEKVRWQLTQAADSGAIIHAGKKTFLNQFNVGKVFQIKLQGLRKEFEDLIANNIQGAYIVPDDVKQKLGLRGNMAIFWDKTDSQIRDKLFIVTY